VRPRIQDPHMNLSRCLRRASEGLGRLGDERKLGLRAGTELGVPTGKHSFLHLQFLSVSILTATGRKGIFLIARSNYSRYHPTYI
jgi:hypothetical protein